LCCAQQGGRDGCIDFDASLPSAHPGCSPHQSGRVLIQRMVLCLIQGRGGASMMMGSSAMGGIGPARPGWHIMGGDAPDGVRARKPRPQRTMRTKVDQSPYGAEAIPPKATQPAALFAALLRAASSAHGMGTCGASLCLVEHILRLYTNIRGGGWTWRRGRRRDCIDRNRLDLPRTWAGLAGTMVCVGCWSQGMGSPV
jgi:hypothetical protein